MSDLPQDPERGEAAHPAARAFLWLERPIVRDAVSLGVVLIAMLLLAADFFVRRHGEIPLAERSGFYPVYAFVGLTLIVLACFPLRRLLSAPPDYYGEPEDRDG